MENSSNQILSSEEQQENSLSRRELLKVLVATGGGLVAAAFLPGRWLKPLVSAGVLPVHAQSSLTLTISGVRVSCIPSPPNDPHPEKQYFAGILTYQDSLCRVGIDPTTYNSWSDNQSMIMDFYKIVGDHCSGQINFKFWATPPTKAHGYLIVGSRNSNQANVVLGCTPP